MPKIITSDEQLRALIPNQLVNVKGETSLFDKLVPYLDQAEQWLFRHFVPAEMADSVSDTAAHIVAVEAYRLAIPQLDLVLTPNGFATVGSQNLSPASKMRVDRLVGGLLSERDKALAQLLSILPSVVDWTNTPQGQWFGSTLFPTLDICRQIGETERLWDKYCELRPQVIDLEASLSEEWLSPELMSALRAENLRSDLTDTRKTVVAQVKAQIVGYLRGGSFNSRRLADIVNYIRQSPSEFDEWHQSATAALFAPPVFRNDKAAKGYFF
jgi:hypothetical protein